MRRRDETPFRKRKRKKTRRKRENGETNGGNQGKRETASLGDGFKTWNRGNQ